MTLNIWNPLNLFTLFLLNNNYYKKFLINFGKKNFTSLVLVLFILACLFYILQILKKLLFFKYTL